MKGEKEKAIFIRDLSVHYGFSPVLWDISLSIPQGKLVGIMGPNGAGKSTFMKAILRLVPATGGIEILGHATLNPVRQRIAYVPQKEQVDWDFPMTVRDLVAMGCYPRKGLFGRMKSEDWGKVDEAIHTMGLSSFSGRQISQLSGGQQQRAFIARAIVQEADLYFLDEPFSGVDLTSEKIIVDVLKQMRDQGKTICVVHHDLSSVESYFDWLVLLNTRLVASGSLVDVFNQKNLRLTYGRNWKLVEDAMQGSLVMKMRGIES